jgi:hypothetical protein
MALTSVKNPETDPSINTYRISNLSDFIKYIEDLDDEFIIFRGQRKDWDLLPKVARLKYFDYAKLEVFEEKMLRAFEREAISFIEKMPDNDWDLLALAQHHTLPTRLLDWTSNPLAGLWFAVCEPPENKECAVVWVLVLDQDDDNIVRSGSNSTSPFGGKNTKVFIPRHISSRIRSQKGVFTVHAFPDKNIANYNELIPLNKQEDYQNSLVKILIPSKYFPNIRFDLDRCGINAATLFPDLDGLAKQIQWTYAYSGDE